MTQVEIDEVPSFVRDVAAKVAPDDAVPGWVVLLVELFLDEGCDVLKNRIYNKNITILEEKKRTIPSSNESIMIKLQILNCNHGLHTIKMGANIQTIL